MDNRIYSYFDTLNDLLADLLPGLRGDTSLGVHVQKLSNGECACFQANSLYTGGAHVYQNVRYAELTASKLISNALHDGINMSAAVALADINNINLNSFTNKSIIGAINELKTLITAGTYWSIRTESAKKIIYPTTSLNINYVDLKDGFLGTNCISPFLLGDIDNQYLIGFTNETLLGALNELKDEINEFPDHRHSSIYDETLTTLMISGLDTEIDFISGTLHLYYEGFPTDGHIVLGYPIGSSNIPTFWIIGEEQTSSINDLEKIYLQAGEVRVKNVDQDLNLFDLGKIYTNSGDTDLDYIENKVDGDGITITEDTGVLLFTCDGKVKSSSGDTTLGYLEDKIQVNYPLSASIVDDKLNIDYENTVSFDLTSGVTEVILEIPLEVNNSCSGLFEYSVEVKDVDDSIIRQESTVRYVFAAIDTDIAIDSILVDDILQVSSGGGLLDDGSWSYAYEDEIISITCCFTTTLTPTSFTLTRKDL